MQFEQTQKYKVNRRRGAVRRPRPSKDDVIDRVTVVKWWTRRLESGRLFDVIADDVRVKRDYKGSLPWPEEARGEALFREFTLSTGRILEKLRFYYLFRSASGITCGDSYPMRMEHFDNKLMYTCMRVMYPVGAARLKYLSNNRS